MQHGITRLEFSSYFYSHQEQVKGINVELFQKLLDNALTAVKKIDNIDCKVSFRDMWDSLWNQTKSVFVFQKDTWTVVYAKNPISSYSG